MYTVYTCVMMYPKSTSCMFGVPRTKSCLAVLRALEVQHHHRKPPGATDAPSPRDLRRDAMPWQKNKDPLII
jgi:hypothetical protein